MGTRYARLLAAGVRTLAFGLSAEPALTQGRLVRPLIMHRPLGRLGEHPAFTDHPTTVVPDIAATAKSLVDAPPSESTYRDNPRPSPGH